MLAAEAVNSALPSPQSTVTTPPPVVKSVKSENGFESVNVAMSTFPVEFPSIPVIVVPTEVSGASVTVAVLVTFAVAPLIDRIDTTTELGVPASVKVV